VFFTPNSALPVMVVQVDVDVFSGHVPRCCGHVAGKSRVDPVKTIRQRVIRNGDLMNVRTQS